MAEGIKSIIAYGGFQSTRIFVSETGMAKQCQLSKMMVLTTRHEGIWLGTKMTYPRISYICICICELFYCYYYKSNKKQYNYFITN